MADQASTSILFKGETTWTNFEHEESKKVPGFWMQFPLLSNKLYIPGNNNDINQNIPYANLSLGGQVGAEGASKDVFVWNSTDFTWNKIGELLTGRYRHGAVGFNFEKQCVE